MRQVEKYAALFELPVHLQTEVLSLEKINNLFKVVTNKVNIGPKK